MFVSPVSRSNCANKSLKNISFKKLKFDLDTQSKEYLLFLGKKEAISNKDMLEITNSADFILSSLTIKANSMADEMVKKTPFLKGKTLDEVWPDETVVSVSIKPRRLSQENMILESYFNGKHFMEEDDFKVFNPQGADREEIRTIDFWSFLADLKTCERLKSFVSKNLVKQPLFNALKNNAPVQEVKDLDEQKAKEELIKWIKR